MKLQKCSLFVAMAGTLMLAAAFAPRAQGDVTELLYYFDFNSDTAPPPPGVAPPYTSVAPGTFGGFPLDQTTMVNGQAGANLFDSGIGAGMSLQNDVGTLTNAFTGDTTSPNDALRLRSNTSATAPFDCYTIGAMDFSGINALKNVSISFALLGGGTGGFTTLQLAYSFDNISFTNLPGTTGTFTNIQNLSTYTKESADLPTTVNGQSTVYVSFCFSGSTNSGESTASFIDNIQVNAVVPEPSTYIGALLGLVGLCWCQRRWFTRLLRLRSA